MEDAKIQALITTWLNEFHSPSTHAEVLRKPLAVGKASHPWVKTIQGYIEGKTMQVPGRGDIKRACRALLEGLE